MKLLVVLVLLLSGCAALDVVERPEALTVCTAADIGTTAYAVHTGLAHEVNPLLAPSVNAHHFLPMVLSKLALVGLIWWAYEQYNDYQIAKAGVGVATVVTCGVSANNALTIIKGIK